MRQEAVIEIERLKKSFGSRRALDELSFSVPAGHVVGFLGPNGAGKTTTLRVTLGLVKADGGDARVFGSRISDAGPDDLRRIGALVEEPAFYATHTGRTNLTIHARLAGVGDDRVDAVLAEVGLTDRAGSRYSSYSHGMKQRLGLASALLTEPDLLILDEPTNGLDPAGIRDLRELLAARAASGKTVLVSSHLLAEVQQMCTYAVIIREGKLVEQGAVAEILGGGDRLVVCVDEIRRACSVLREHGFDVESKSDDRLELPEGKGRGSDVNRILAEAGIYASTIVERAPTLEEAFLELMSDVPDGGSAGGESNV